MSAPKSLREAVEKLRDDWSTLIDDPHWQTVVVGSLDAILAAHPDAPEPVTPPFAGLPDHMHGFAGLPDHWQPTTALPPPASRREETPKKTCGSCREWRAYGHEFKALMDLHDARNGCHHPNRPVRVLPTNSDYGCPLHQWAEPQDPRQPMTHCDVWRSAQALGPHGADLQWGGERLLHVPRADRAVCRVRGGNGAR